MPATIVRSPLWFDPRVQPPPNSVEIDWAHPLARGLSSFLLPHHGAVVDLVGGVAGTPVGTTVTWGYFAQPPLRAVGSSDPASYVALTPIQAPMTSVEATQTGATTLVFVNRLGLSGDRRFLSTPWWALKNAGESADFVTWGVSGAGSLDNPITWSGRQWLAVRWLAPTTTLGVWTNGAQISTQTDARGIDPVRHGTSFRLGGGSGTGNGLVLVGYLANWRRALSDDELRWLTAGRAHVTDQFAFLRPIVRRRWFVSEAPPPPPPSGSASRRLLVGVGV